MAFTGTSCGSLGRQYSFVKERGTNLSRSRWTYMVNGHRYVDDRVLLEHLAEFFDADPEFLAGASRVSPVKVSIYLDQIREMRATRVKTYATRTMGDTSPTALQTISAVLDEEITQQ